MQSGPDFGTRETGMPRFEFMRSETWELGSAPNSANPANSANSVRYGRCSMNP